MTAINTCLTLHRRETRSKMQNIMPSQKFLLLSRPTMNSSFSRVNCIRFSHIILMRMQNFLFSSLIKPDFLVNIPFRASASSFSFYCGCRISLFPVSSSLIFPLTSLFEHLHFILPLFADAVFLFSNMQGGTSYSAER